VKQINMFCSYILSFSGDTVEAEAEEPAGGLMALEKKSEINYDFY
jgi:hypothetical protein